MSIPKRHHFVPESYLNGFAEEGTDFLNVYSKSSGLWRRQKPNQVMVRNKYYRQEWAPEGVDKNILEKTLGSTVEPNGITSLRKLVSAAETLDDDDTASILAYLQLQRIRVPRQAEMAKSAARTALTNEIMKTHEGRQVLREGKVVIKDSFRFEFMRNINGALSPYFSRMIWELIKAGPGLSFVTSDSPVSFYNVDFLPPLTEPGPALYGTVVLFPINKRNLLLMRHPEYERGERKASDALPRDLDIEDGVIEIRKDIVWGEGEVNSHNWTMLQLCQDLIVGESKEALEKAIGQEIFGHN